MRSKIVKIFSLVVVIVMVATTSAHAYSLTGWYLYYKTAYFKWGDYIQTSGSTVRNAWEDAIDDWNDACSANFYYSSGAISELNSMHDDDDELLGWTYTYPNTDGSVAYFFGYLNAWSPYIGQTNVARSSANHELGHVLGLDELYSGRAIMNLHRDRTSIYLPQTDDLNGIAAIYGD